MSSSTGSATPEEGEKVRRPMNAFILWSRKRRRELASEDPNMHNFEISKRLGIEWNRLDSKEKQQFYDEAQKLKEEHRKNYPDYKYHPRRKPRRRFTPIDTTPHFRMTYLLPSERALQPEKTNPCPCPGYQSIQPGAHHWSLFPGLSGGVQSERSYLHSSHPLELHYLPPPYGNMALPAGYYGIPEFTTKVPSSFGHPLQTSDPMGPGTDKNEVPLQMLARLTPTGLMRREALLRRAAETSLEFRMRAPKDESSGDMDPSEQPLDPSSKQNTSHFDEGMNCTRSYATDGYHRQLSSGHVCLGCQGNVPFYQGAMPS